MQPHENIPSATERQHAIPFDMKTHFTCRDCKHCRICYECGGTGNKLSYSIETGEYSDRQCDVCSGSGIVKDLSKCKTDCPLKKRPPISSAEPFSTAPIGPVETRYCEWCGSEFPQHDDESNAKYRNRRFCNRTCAARWGGALMSRRSCEKKQRDAMLYLIAKAAA